VEKFKVSIIIPVYNEESTIKNVLEELREFLENKKEIEYEIICVNDSSKDNSLKILKSISFIKVINHKTNRGYGASLKSGIKSASNDIILIMDSDGQHKPQDIPRILKPLKNGYDMVVGSRKITNTQKNRVLGKILIHKLANYLMRAKIPDINSGFRAFYKEDAKKVLHLCSERFSFTTSLTAIYLQEYKSIRYIPIEVRDRSGGKSSVNIKTGFRTILKIIQIVMAFNPLRVILPISFFFAILSFISFVHDLFKMNLTDTTVLLSTMTVLIFIFALISDQISTLRKELWIR